VYRELRRKGVTLTLLWQEYKAVYPDGYQFTQFCEHYKRWLGTQELVMRQHHRAGEKLFIDYAGQTMPVVDPKTGESRTRKCSRRTWVPAITPSARPPGRSNYRIGSGRMRGP
jgi:transposase